MTEKHFILGTAGHVDHGKSSLVKALTGTDPDRLPEEKARGITIDLGFAHLELAGPSAANIQPSIFSIGIVDVPGHEDFVRNMIAGVGSIDLALLAVAADDGWMPQTEEHLQILQYLDVRRMVVVLTKIDLGNVDRIRSSIRESLKDSPFANCPIVSTSVRTGEGIDDLKKALASEFAALSPQRDIGKPRLFVDRAFTLRGVGTIVTGTLSDGTLRTGDSVSVQPGNVSARVRSLQSHNRELDSVGPATRAALNLPELKIPDDIKRGDVLSNRAFESSLLLDVVLTRSARQQRASPIKSGCSAYVHHGTRRASAKIVLADTKSLASGEKAVARLRLDAPLTVFVGDRLIVRDPSEQQTLAGAFVFNNDAQEFRSSQECALLATRAVAPDDAALALWTEIARTGLIERSRLLERSRFSADEIERCLHKLSEHGEIFLTETIGAKMLVWLELRQRGAELIEEAHKSHPERRGIEINTLRAQFSSLPPAVFEALIADLSRREFVRSGSAIAKRSHEPNLPPQLKPVADAIRAMLDAKPYDPPSRKELLKNDLHRQALRFLIEENELMEIGEDLVLSRKSFDAMRAAVSDFISRNGPATTSQLRERLSTSRRVIIPLLEYLDRNGVTRRVGDQRVLASARKTVV
ncbi:MAG TPA: selenocysteine-specific translation elongation factor [Chthoniobacterales bacterium]|nr:selenocysteine-specific translation elongation factor [Chthoniobacterales bacterium]